MLIKINILFASVLSLRISLYVTKNHEVKRKYFQFSISKWWVNMYHWENNSAYLTLFPQQDTYHQDTYHLDLALLELVEFGFYCFGFGLFVSLFFFFSNIFIFISPVCVCIYSVPVIWKVELCLKHRWLSKAFLLGWLSQNVTMETIKFCISKYHISTFKKKKDTKLPKLLKQKNPNSLF